MSGSQSRKLKRVQEKQLAKQFREAAATQTETGDQEEHEQKEDLDPGQPVFQIEFYETPRGLGVQGCAARQPLLGPDGQPTAPGVRAGMIALNLINTAVQFAMTAAPKPKDEKKNPRILLPR